MYHNILFPQNDCIFYFLYFITFISNLPNLHRVLLSEDVPNCKFSFLIFENMHHTHAIIQYNPTICILSFFCTNGITEFLHLMLPHFVCNRNNLSLSLSAAVMTKYSVMVETGFISKPQVPLAFSSIASTIFSNIPYLSPLLN